MGYESKSNGSRYNKGDKPGFGGKKFNNKYSNDKPGFKRFKKYEEKKPVALTREDRKELRKKRRSQKKHAESAEQVNSVYQSNISGMKTDARLAESEKVMNASIGKMFDLCLRHDTCRALQLIIKHGSAAQRTKVFGELKEKLIDLIKNKTGHFMVLKLAQYCSQEEKNQMIEAFRGKMRKLSMLADGAQVLDYLYMTAPKVQQYIMLREFLDQAFAVFKNEALAETIKFDFETEANAKKAAQYKATMTPEQIKLIGCSEVEIRQNPDKLMAWMLARRPESQMSLFDSVEVYLNRSIDKEQLMFRFTHAILFQYLTNASIETSSKRDIISSCCRYLLALHHSKDGAMAAVHCLAYATAKDRKNAVKAIKGRVVELALHEYGYLIVLKLIESTDDSVLLKKQIIAELVAPATFGVAPYLYQLASSKHGAKILFYLLAPHTPTYFSAIEMKVLERASVPAYILSKKQANDDDKEKEKEKEKEEYNDGDKETIKDFERITKENEKKRLAQKAEEEAEAVSSIIDRTMVKTSKKNPDEKVFDLAHVILEPLLQAFLLNIAQANGTFGQGSKSTSNIDLSQDRKKKEEMKDDDEEEEEQDDDEDNQDEDAEEDDDEEEEEEADPVVKLRSQAKEIGKPFAVLNGLLKHQFGVQVATVAILAAYNFNKKPNAASNYGSSLAAAEQVFHGAAVLCEDGETDLTNYKEGSNEIVDYADNSHVLLNFRSHLFYKRVFAGLPDAGRAAFAQQLWSKLSGNKDLLSKLTAQNRSSFTLANVLENLEGRATAAKILTAALPKLGKKDAVPVGVETLKRVIAGGSTAREEKKEEKEEKKVEKKEEKVEKKTDKKEAKKAEEKKAVVEEKKAVPAKTPRASRRKGEDSDAEDIVPIPLVEPPTPRRSTRASSNPSTPLSAPNSSTFTPRRSARRGSKTEEMMETDLPSFTLEKVVEEEEEDVQRELKAVTPRKRKATTPAEISDDEDEVVEKPKAKSKATSTPKRASRK